MSEISPYLIRHVQLDANDISEIPKPELGNRYYFIFWWLKIPLGHLYVERDDHTNFKEKILEAILPTLKNYNCESQQLHDITISYNNHDFLKFSALISKVLSTYLSKEIPAKVEVSVIVCTHNRSESLKNCLQSINNQICKPAEIIVIDNAPPDESTKNVVNQFNNVIYHREPRTGLSIARNLGVKLAQHPIIAFTDDDVMVHSLWTYNIWISFESRKVDGLTGLVLATSLDTESQQIFEKYWGFNKGYEDIIFDLNFIHSTEGVPRVWEIGAGANMAFKKDVLVKLNYFDERLGAGASGCSEDSEIWYKMLINGYKIHYTPRAIVFHEHRKEIIQLKKQIYSYMRGHVASALLQHKQNENLGYKSYIFNLPKYYLLLFRIGFPTYKFRYRTLWSEVKGYISGINFYYRNKKKPPLTL
ncbi:glycosyltransferase family 2 protein [Mariniflexile sp.]|uniref:glycosyltransferase family 2 protein n=1 Tax=Mariniflexile sp. TaxID=1979402 RepID=UPI003568D402